MNCNFNQILDPRQLLQEYADAKEKKELDRFIKPQNPHNDKKKRKNRQKNKVARKSRRMNRRNKK